MMVGTIVANLGFEFTLRMEVMCQQVITESPPWAIPTSESFCTAQEVNI